MFGQLELALSSTVLPVLGVQRSQRVHPRDHHALFDTREYMIHNQAAHAPRFSLALPVMVSTMLTRLYSDAGPPQDLCIHPHAPHDEFLNGIFFSDTSNQPHPASANVPQLTR